MKKLLLLLLSVFFSCFESRASHVMGAEITYKAISNLKFQVTIKIYRDCRGIPLGNPTTFAISCETGGPSYAITPTKTSIRDITPKCDTVSISPCSPENTTVSKDGIEEHTYIATVDFNVNPLSTALANGCCSYRIYLMECCRNGAINTGSAGQYYIYASINVCRAPVNNSPQFTNPANVTLCCNQPFIYNSGVVDTADHDSLAYALIPAAEDTLNNFQYGGGYSATRPLTPYLPGSPNQVVPTANPPIGFYVDPLKGDIIFTPTGCSEVGPVVLGITEYRKDSTGIYRKIGSTMRDLQFMVKSCTNNTPTLSGVGQIVFCEGVKTCIEFTARDQQVSLPPPNSFSKADSLKLQWNGAISDASFIAAQYTALSGTTLKLSEKKGSFCWTPAFGSARTLPYNFTVTAEDNSCSPRPAQITRSYAIIVRKSSIPNRYYQVLPCGRVAVKGDTVGKINSWSWYARDSSGNLLNLDWVNKINSTKMLDTFQFLRPGKYIISLSAGYIPNGCIVTFYDTFNVNTGFNALIGTAKSDTTLCINSNVLLTANVQGAASPLKYKWSSSPALPPGPDSASVFAFKAVNPAKITLRVTDSSGCTMGSALNYKTSGFFNLSPTVTACKNDTAWLLGPAYSSSYLWSPGSYNGRTYGVTTPGLYTIYAVDSLGCGFTDSIRFDTLPLPGLRYFGKDTVHCYSDSVTIYASPGMASYLWSDSSKLPYTRVASAGMVSVQITDFAGCRNRDSVNVILDSVPAFTFQVQTLGPRRFKFTPSLAGNYTYNWDLGNGTVSDTFETSYEYPVEASYKVCLWIYSSQGCKDSVCAMVNAYSVNTLSKAFNVNVFPNPFINELGLRFNLPSATELSYALYDITGREIIVSAPETLPAGEFKKNIELGNLKLPEGVYMLKLKLNQNYIYLRLIKSSE